MNTIDKLRKMGELQAHHWLATHIVVESLLDKSLRNEIGLKCRELEFSSACYGIDPFALVNRAVVLREAISGDPKVIGVLRETLNSIYRLRTRH